MSKKPWKPGDLYVWYSPRINHIRVSYVPLCTQYKSCTWATCPTYWYVPGLKKKPKKPDISLMAAYYYIGEF